MANERTLSQLHAQFGPDADSFKTVLFKTEVNSCDVVDEYYIPDIWDVVGDTILLDWYSEVKQVIIQNTDDTHYLEFDYDDAISGTNYVNLIPPGESVAICQPDVTVDIALICDDADESVDAHITVVGKKL